MSTTTNVNQIKLNIMTQEQYDAAEKSASELYMITDADSGQTIQVTTLPTASASELDKIYQYIGTTDTYTNGYFYKCVSDGQSTPTYSWTAVQVQAGGGLPSQAGNTGKFLTTDGTDASWATVDTLPSQSGQSGKFLTTDGTSASWGDALTNTSTGTNSITIASDNSNNKWNSINIGKSSQVLSDASVAYGTRARVTSGDFGIAIGDLATVSASYGIAISGNCSASYSVQLGQGTNSKVGTLHFGTYNGGWVNYEVVSRDGTIPTDRFTTTPVADGTYVPTLTISSGTATRSWGTGGSSYTAGTNISISNDTISTSAAQVVIRRFS